MRHISNSSDICTTICDNFDDNFHFLSSYWFKIIEREKKYNVSMRDKVVTKWCTNIITLFQMHMLSLQ